MQASGGRSSLSPPGRRLWWRAHTFAALLRTALALAGAMSHKVGCLQPRVPSLRPPAPCLASAACCWAECTKNAVHRRQHNSLLTACQACCLLCILGPAVLAQAAM